MLLFEGYFKFYLHYFLYIECCGFYVNQSLAGQTIANTTVATVFSPKSQQKDNISWHFTTLEQ
jgi:hypothetical protein